MKNKVYKTKRGVSRKDRKRIYLQWYSLMVDYYNNNNSNSNNETNLKKKNIPENS